MLLATIGITPASAANGFDSRCCSKIFHTPRAQTSNAKDEDAEYGTAGNEPDTSNGVVGRLLHRCAISVRIGVACEDPRFVRSRSRLSKNRSLIGSAFECVGTTIEIDRGMQFLSRGMSPRMLYKSQPRTGHTRTNHETNTRTQTRSSKAHTKAHTSAASDRSAGLGLKSMGGAEPVVWSEDHWKPA
jgi:hypothetical protein